jgi:DNA-binding NtrC family response regulator
MRAAIIPNVKIAVVDSDRLIRDFIVNVMMYSVNREVLSFEDAAGLKAYLLAGGNVHLVLSEIHLPGESGFKLLQHVKQDFPKVVFIAISAHPGDETAAVELDADAYMAKPFVLKDLFGIVQKFVVEG